MKWRHQIIFHDTDPDPEKHWYGLHEVYYEGDTVTSWTEQAGGFVCDAWETEKGILKELSIALASAIQRPVLFESQLREQGVTAQESEQKS
jgi:hypothetical protein